MKKIFIPSLYLVASNFGVAVAQNSNKISTPNVIVILADDLGYGDISCNGPYALQTPNIDKLATTGLNFTDGHSSAATSTPSRYSLLTGYYPSRNSKANILPGDAPLIIDTQRQNLPQLFKQAGYSTGVVGKWHLGLGSGNADWNKKLIPGPNEIGFDYSYLLAATCDRMPNVYLENGWVQQLDANDPIEVSYVRNFDGEPTGKLNPELLRLKTTHGHVDGINNGVSRIGFQKGGKSALFVDENMADSFLLKASQFVEINKNKPFFLYYALHEPHVPRLPNQRFLGKSGLGTRGDAILEADWCIGEFMEKLEELGLRDNTIIVFSSDNGPVLDDGYDDKATELNGEHKPAGIYKGWKATNYEGGTRVPFIVNWQNHIKPGKSDALVSQIDLFASFASLLKQKCVKTDSENLISTFLGKSNKGRKNLVVEGVSRKMTYREGNWAYMPGYETKNGKTKPELYDLKNDISQTNNLVEKMPKKLASMAQNYEKIRAASLSEK